MTHISKNETLTVPETDECKAVMEELRQTMAERDMVLSMLQNSSTISQDVYRMIRDDYEKVFARHMAAKNKCSDLIMSLFETDDGVLQWNYDQMGNHIYVSVDPFHYESSTGNTGIPFNPSFQ